MSRDGEALLAAITGRPDDRAARLVYADWLDEHADPRGELVRIEEEMRGLPASADRYWDLKPRRNELRAACEPGWLAVMDYGTLYRPVFTEWPDDWRGRWRLLRELVERWYRVPMPDVGGREWDARWLVQPRLGRPVPEGVREWLALAADLQNGEATREVMRDLCVSGSLRVRDDFPGWLQLLARMEGDVIWAVRLDHLDRDDPPVNAFLRETPAVWPRRMMEMRGLEPDQPPEMVETIDYDTGGWDEDEPLATFGSVSGFALSYVLTYLGGGGTDRPVTLDDEFFARMAAEYPVHSRIDGIELFERAGGIAHVYPGSGMLTVRG